MEKILNTTIDVTNSNIKTVVNDEIRRLGNESNLNHIDVSKVTSMQGVFANSSFNGDISKWNVFKVTNMTGLFYNSSFNGDISKWNVSKVTNMAEMFRDSLFDGDISKWNVSSVVDVRFMFIGTSFNNDISGWDVSKVDNIYRISMFDNCPIKEEYKPKFNTIKEENVVKKIIANNNNIRDIVKSEIDRLGVNANLNHIDVSNVTDMYAMFQHSLFNGDISNWNVSNVMDMRYMFAHSKFNGDISNWYVGRDTNTKSMFDNCPIRKEYTPNKRRKIIFKKQSKKCPPSPHHIDVEKAWRRSINKYFTNLNEKLEPPVAKEEFTMTLRVSGTSTDIMKKLAELCNDRIVKCTIVDTYSDK